MEVISHKMLDKETWRCCYGRKSCTNTESMVACLANLLDDQIQNILNTFPRFCLNSLFGYRIVDGRLKSLSNSCLDPDLIQ